MVKESYDGAEKVFIHEKEATQFCPKVDYSTLLL